jgi:hypothetical protein
VVKGAQPRTVRYWPAAKQYLGIKKSIRIPISFRGEGGTAAHSQILAST